MHGAGNCLGAIIDLKHAKNFSSVSTMGSVTTGWSTTLIAMYRGSRLLNAPLFASSFDFTHGARIRDECPQIIEFGKDGSYSRG